MPSIAKIYRSAVINKRNREFIKIICPTLISIKSNISVQSIGPFKALCDCSAIDLSRQNAHTANPLFSPSPASVMVSEFSWRALCHRYRRIWRVENGRGATPTDQGRAEVVACRNVRVAVAASSFVTGRGSRSAWKLLNARGKGWPLFPR